MWRLVALWCTTLVKDERKNVRKKHKENIKYTLIKLEHNPSQAEPRQQVRNDGIYHKGAFVVSQ